MKKYLAPISYGVLMILIITLGYFGVSRDWFGNYGELSVVFADDILGGIVSISPNAPLTITFNQPMEELSISNNYKINPEIAGEIKVSDNKVMFIPSVEFKKGDRYSLTLLAGIESRSGEKLVEDFTQSYIVGDLPAVVLATPINEMVNPESDAVNIVFNKQVSALSTIDSTIINNISIEPKISGEYQLIGGNTISFVADGGFKYGTEYSVTIDKNFTFIDGSVLGDTYTYSFNTPEIDIDSVFVSYEKGNPINALLNVAFIPEIELDVSNIEISEVASYSEKEGGENPISNIGEYAKVFPEEDILAQKAIMKGVSSSVIKEEENYKLSNLLKDKIYAVKIKGVSSVNASSEMVVKYILFKTPSDLEVVATTPEDGESTSNFYSFSIDFSNPLDKFEDSEDKDIEDFYMMLSGHIVIEPSVSKIEYSSYGGYVYVNAKFLPATTYNIKVTPGIYDIYGTTIDQDYKFSFTTQDYDSYISFQDWSDVVLLPIKEEIKYPFYTTNIEGVSLELCKVDEQNYIKGRDWQVRDNMDYKYNSNECYKINKQVNYEKNIQKIQSINFQKDFNLSGLSGLYMLKIDSDELYTEENDYDQSLKRLIVFTDMVTTLKSSSDQIFVWVNDSANGEPINNATVSVYLQDKKIASGYTNKDGVFISDYVADDTWGEYTVITQKSSFDGVSYNNRDRLTASATDEVLEFLSGSTNTDDKKLEEMMDVYNNATAGSGMELAKPIEEEADSNVKKVTTSSRFGMVSSYWNQGIGVWNFNINSFKYDWEMKSGITPRIDYAYTDRPIYRPGQKVYIKGILRQLDKSLKLSKVEKETEVVVVDSKSTDIYKSKIPVTEFGTFILEINLPIEAPLGRYNILVDDEYTAWFWVKEYEKPTYKVEVTSEKDDYVSLENMDIQIDAGYYFGGFLKNAQTNLYVSEENYYFDRYQGDKYYSFWDDRYYCFECWWWDPGEGYSTIMTKEGITDDQGKVSFSVPLDLKEQKQSKRYIVEADVIDPNTKDHISKQKALFIHKANIYAGIRLDKYYYTKDDIINVDMITVDTLGKVMLNQKVDLEILKTVWKTIKKKDTDGNYYYENSSEEEKVNNYNLITNSEGKISQEVIINQGGQYKFYVKVRDDKNNENIASVYTYVSDNDTYINWGSENDYTLELVTDKQMYNVGDTAHILLRSPFDKFELLLTHERMKVDNYEVVKVDNTTYSIEVPITEDMMPDYYIGAILIRGAQQDDDKILPQIRVGYAKLFVNTEDREVDIKLNTDKKHYNPREKVKLSLDVLDKMNKPISDMEISVAVVDEAVLALKDTGLPELLRVFYDILGLGVNTSSSIIKLVSKDELEAADKAFAESAAKGGGGGDDIDRDTRAKFEDTAFFIPNLVTDKSGKVTTEFDLPDNLTTWRVIAIGVTKDTLVGASSYNFKTTKPLALIPNTPRFVIKEDKSVFGVTIVNNSENDIEATVDIRLSSGAEVVGDNYQNIALGKGDSTIVEFDVAVLSDLYPRLRVEFGVDASHDLSDSVVKYIPKYNYGTKEAVALDGMTDSIDNVQINMYNSDMLDGNIVIKLAATVMPDLIELYRFFISYNYGCTEQVMSKILSFAELYDMQNMILHDLKKDINLFEIVDSEEILPIECLNKEECNLEKLSVDIINTGIQKIYSKQKDDGGFTYFDSYDAKSSPYLTAYIYFGLSSLSDLGYLVDKEVLSAAEKYLINEIKNGYTISDAIILKEYKNKEYSADFQAMVGYILALNNNSQAVSILNSAYSKIDQLSNESEALLVMAYVYLGKDIYSAQLNKLEGIILNNIEIRDRYAQVKQEDQNWLFMQTPYRSNVMMAMALMDLNKDELVYKVMKYIAISTDSKSTQDNIWSIKMYKKYMNYTGDLQGDYNVQVKTNKSKLIDTELTSDNIFDSITEKFSIGDITDKNWFNIFFEKTGKGNLYYDIVYDYTLPWEKILSRNRGFTIDKEFYDLDGNIITSAKVGNIIKSDVSIFVPESRYYVSVEDYFPAGMEPIDFELDTSSQSLRNSEKRDCENWYDCWYDQDWRFSHKEFRDDKVFLFADFLPKGEYHYEYYLKVRHAGNYHIRPAYIEQMYYPEVFGRDDATIMEIIN